MSHVVNIFNAIIFLAIYISGLGSFQLPCQRIKFSCRTVTLQMGLFDNLFPKKTTNDNNTNNDKKSLKDIQKEEQIQIQKEILERRRNPSKMLEYERQKDAERQKYAEERAVYKFQSKTSDGYDPLTDWKRLKDEGKIKMSKDLERDTQSSRLGSEGLIEVRVDERMPYIDQGYVDEDSDAMGKFMGLFKKKDKK
jgi:hypothetical protein